MDDKTSMDTMGTTAQDTPRNGHRPIPPLNDVVFLSVFGSEDSKTISMALVNAALKVAGLKPIQSVEHISADARIPHSTQVKSPHCDVVVTSENFAAIVEAQLYKVDYEGKATYYAASSLASRAKRSTDWHYREVPQTVVVFLVQGHEIFPDSSQAVTIGRLHWELDDGCKPGSDKIVFIFCELDKVAARYNEHGMDALDGELEAWLYVLAEGYRNEEETRKIMEYLKIPSLAEFIERYNLALSDPDTLAAYDCHVKDILEINSIRYSAAEDGYQKGIEEGRQKGLEEGLEEGMKKGLKEGLKEERARIISLLEENGVSGDLIAQI